MYIYVQVYRSDINICVLDNSCAVYLAMIEG